MIGSRSEARSNHVHILRAGFTFSFVLFFNFLYRLLCETDNDGNFRRKKKMVAAL